MGLQPNPPTAYVGLALRVKAVLSAGSIILDATNAYFKTIAGAEGTGSWELRTISDANAAAAAPFINYGTKTFFTYWEGLDADGDYVFRDMGPSFPDISVASLSAITTKSVTTTGTLIPSVGADRNIFTISATLGDWYAQTIRKLSPNSIYPYGGTTEFYCMSNFQDLMLLANDEIIFYSDASLGGWREQFNTGSFVRIGSREHGRITSICGTQDFLVVSRERKVYVVTGNIPTNNYKIQEVINAEIGAWSNTSSVNIKDSIVFISTNGVFQITGGGTCTKLSELAPKNFNTYSIYHDNTNDVVFRLTGTVSKLGVLAFNDVDRGLSVGYDSYRELLVFMKRNDTTPALVIHTKTGEVYEWNGIASPSAFEIGNALDFIGGVMYTGTEVAAGVGARKFIEDKNRTTRNYPVTYPIKLYTSWLTSGEPSLEKILLQLKIFGYINPSGTNTLMVSSYKDWDINTKTTNSAYYPIQFQEDVQFSHKKRLNSDKVLSASVGFEINTAITDFDIEGFEVEFSPIQEGMKR